MKRTDRILRVFMWLSIALLIGVYIFDPTKGIPDEPSRQLIRMALLRICAIPALVCCITILRLCLTERRRTRILAFFLPAMVIALNNSPWLPLAVGDAKWNGSAAVWWLLLQVVGVGVMEELAFRGILLPLLLDRFGRTKKGMWTSILLSSAVFGMMHFLNLLESPNLVAVLLQVGYSALLGAMCAVLFLGTGNIWYCIAVHTVYNFGGGISTYFVAGTVWDLPNVLCTLFVSVAVAGWYFYLTLKTDPKTLPTFRKEKKQKEEDAENA